MTKRYVVGRARYYVVGSLHRLGIHSLCHREYVKGATQWQTSSGEVYTIQAGSGGEVHW